MGRTVMRTKHWSEIYSCGLCGKRFGSYAAEAMHRHNVPVMCKPKKRKKVSKTNTIKQ